MPGILALCMIAAVLAAGPSIMAGQSTKYAVWSAIVAVAGYVKGLLEEKP